MPLEKVLMRLPYWFTLWYRIYSRLILSHMYLIDIHVPDSTITIFIYYCSDGLDVSFSTISARMAWENAFDNAYIKPTVEVSLLNFWGNFKLLYLTEFRSKRTKSSTNYHE